MRGEASFLIDKFNKKPSIKALISNLLANRSRKLFIFALKALGAREFANLLFATWPELKFRREANRNTAKAVKLAEQTALLSTVIFHGALIIIIKIYYSRVRSSLSFQFVRAAWFLWSAWNGGEDTKNGPTDVLHLIREQDILSQILANLGGVSDLVKSKFYFVLLLRNIV